MAAIFAKHTQSLTRDLFLRFLNQNALENQGDEQREPHGIDRIHSWLVYQIRGADREVHYENEIDRRKLQALELRLRRSNLLTVQKYRQF